MLDYAALAVVSAVIREGTFERAAAALCISPSAVSQRVRALEERLGASLIARTQPCQPTDLGRRLCAHFDRVRLLEAELAPTLPAGMARRPVTLPIAANADSLATWLPDAIAAFASASGCFIELALDDEAHTAERLRSGEVMAVVSSDPAPVPGCKTSPLGTLRYIACASPDFVARHFPQGPGPEALATAPHMRFDRRDGLQASWAQRRGTGPLSGTTHWVPSTHAFLDLGLRGLGWAMQPEALARPHIAAGRLVELVPDAPLDVPLYWTVARLHAGPLRALSEAVGRAARAQLRR